MVVIATQQPTYLSILAKGTASLSSLRIDMRRLFMSSCVVAGASSWPTSSFRLCVCVFVAEVYASSIFLLVLGNFSANWSFQT